MDTVRNQIARNIKKFRIERGMNVDEVGSAVGKSGKTVSAWEVGRGQPDADTLIALCRLFEVDIKDFYGESGELSYDEKQLIEHYRSMSGDGRLALLTVASGLSGIFHKQEGGQK